MAASVVPYIKDHDAVLLGNHGVVTVGKDLRGPLPCCRRWSVWLR